MIHAPTFLLWHGNRGAQVTTGRSKGDVGARDGDDPPSVVLNVVPMAGTLAKTLLLVVALVFVAGCKKDQIEDKTLPIVVYYALPG